MKILVSSCLLGENCKYNGKNNYNEKVVSFLNKYEIVSVCPEQLGGLTTPRLPSEVKNQKVIRKDGKDVTKNFQNGAMITLEIAKENNCTFAILKKKSPSCGFGEIYDGSFTSTIIKGNGVTADLLYSNGVVICNEINFDEIINKNVKK